MLHDHVKAHSRGSRVVDIVSFLDDVSLADGIGQGIIGRIHVQYGLTKAHAWGSHASDGVDVVYFVDGASVEERVGQDILGRRSIN